MVTIKNDASINNDNMIKYSTVLYMHAAILLVLQQPVAAQTCISGDCKNGYGVMQVGCCGNFKYQVGNFNKKSRLDGKGALLYWYNEGKKNEADFVAALSQGPPTLEKLRDFKPSVIQTGNFVKGEQEGPGLIVEDRMPYFSPFSWISSNWFNNEKVKYFRYEGSFINSIAQPAGVVTFIYATDTLICASDNLHQKDLNLPIEMVIDIRRSNSSRNQLIRGNFINKKMHGWALKCEPRPGTTQNVFYRQLWLYGKLIHEDNGGAYPFDMDNAQTFKDEKGREFTGPMVNGKINGFGTIRYGYNNQYQGYIKDNLPHGYGFMDTIGATKYGLFNKGFFEQGTWITYWVNRLIVTEGKKDNFKEGYIKQATHDNLEYYVAGYPPLWSFEGYMIQATGWQGKVLRTDYNSKTETWYDKGVQISSSSEINNIMVWQVYVKDGIASMVVRYNPSSKEAVLSDGRVINTSNKSEYKPSSKYYTSHFYTVCPCGGDGKTTTTAEVSGYTKSWTRTEQVNKSAVVGYWQGTQQVTSTYYTPGYSITRKVACENPNAEWVPFGVGTRHSVLATKFFKE